MPPTPSIIAFGLLTVTVVTAAVVDFKTRDVPNWLTYPVIVLGLGLTYLSWWAHGGPEVARSHFIDALVALAAGLVPFAIVFYLGGIGGGDVKLMAAIGAVSGMWQVVLATAFYGFIVGLIMAVFVMVRGRIVRQTLLRVFGAVVAVAARAKPDIPTDSPRLPYALAFAAGAILAGAEYLLGLELPWSGLV